MRIGLLTYHNSFNYGAVIQSYATTRILKEMGHIVEFINIQQSEDRKIKHLVFLKKTIQFNRFMRNYYPMQTQRFYTIDELRAYCFDFDCLMVGSDQTWNPAISREKCIAYFLDFGSPTIRRISYASSFGFSAWPSEFNHLVPEVRNALDHFDSISVRESSGQRILKEVFSKNSSLVLDPTMLHRDYSEITGDIKYNGEICCYLLNRTSEQLNFAKFLGREYNMKPTMISNVYPLRGFHYVYPPSLQNWLKHIGGAKLVITDSFHGVVFSLLYHRNFVVITPDNGRTSRLYDLLSSLGLENRFFTDYTKIVDSKIWESSIDFESIDTMIESQRQHSIAYLKSALQ